MKTASCCTLIFLLACVSVSPLIAQETSPIWRLGAAGELQGATMHRVAGDLFEVYVWVTTEDDNGVTKRRYLTADDITKWTIEEGDGQLLTDPGTGRMLFKPSSDQALVVRPTMGKLVGDPIVVGVATPELLAKTEEGLDSGGGGVCGHRNGPRMFDEPVDVRSVVSISVMPVSKTERVVRYTHGDYYSFHPDVGTMRIQYNRDRTSEVRLTSHSETGEPFFPAKANGELYFIIETLRNGWKIANWEPMTIEATVLHWPPFETPVVNTEGVSFHSMEQPDVEMHRIAYQELYLYPTREIEVEVERFGIRKGILQADFTLTNLTENGGNIRWFLIGDTNKPLSPTTGVHQMTSGSSFKVSYRAAVKQSAIPQFITLGAVSETGARMVGSRRVNFNTAERAGEKIALIEVPMERITTSPVAVAAP